MAARVAGSGFPVAKGGHFSPKTDNTFTCLFAIETRLQISLMRAEPISCSILIHGNGSNVKHMPDEMIPQFVKLVKPTGAQCWAGGRPYPAAGTNVERRYSGRIGQLVEGIGRR